MKTPIAILNLWHQGAKTMVSTGGVAFALLLVFMQLGFMGAVSHTATNVLENLKFDIMIRARDYVHLYEPGQIDQRWLTIAEGTDGVASADPFWITIQNWRRLPTQVELDSGTAQTQYLPIAVMAFEPEDNLFDLTEIEAHVADDRLSLSTSLLVDDSTQADYGPLIGKHFSDADLQRETEIGGSRFAIEGLFKLGTGLAANGAVITSHLGFARVTPWNVRSTASLGLVRVEGGTVEVARVLARLRERMSLDAKTYVGRQTPADPSTNPLGSEGDISRHDERAASDAERPASAVAVWSRQEVLDLEKERWLWQTPIGLIFQLGVLLSLLVGAAIVYMVLSTDVANRLPEYATLLAIGYSRIYLASIVMTQALCLSLLGFLAAWLSAEGLYRLTSEFSSIPLRMDATRVLLVGGLGLLMCCFSGLLALRKLWKAEPASLF